jgi:hypothetical protein
MKLLIGILFLSLLFLSACSFSLDSLSVTTVEVEKTTRPPVDSGEICDSPFRIANCKEGFTCVNVSVDPHVIGVCFPEDEVNSEDFSIEDYRLRVLLDDDAIGVSFIN